MSLLEGLKNHMGMECLVIKGLKLGQAVWILFRKCIFAVPLVPESLETRSSGFTLLTRSSACDPQRSFASLRMTETLRKTETLRMTVGRQDDRDAQDNSVTVSVQDPHVASLRMTMCSSG